MTDLKTALEDADAAVLFAQGIRRLHARRTGRSAPNRVRDIEQAQERLRVAMVPLRSAIGRFPYMPQTTRAEEVREQILEASKMLQRERRKLHKMKPRSAA